VGSELAFGREPLNVGSDPALVRGAGNDLVSDVRVDSDLLVLEASILC